MNLITLTNVTLARPIIVNVDLIVVLMKSELDGGTIMQLADGSGKAIHIKESLEEVSKLIQSSKGGE